MNNYTLSQRLLHRVSLAPEIVRQLSFDIEKSLYLKKIKNQSNSHVFVTGLARSGTTILLRAIHETEEFASLTYEDMPFVMAPNTWGKFRKNQAQSEPEERAHGDGIKVSTESPEAFEEVFWRSVDDDNRIEEFQQYVSLVAHSKAKKRYLSKNNQNVHRLKELSEEMPESRFFVPFRDPLQHAQSLLEQHKRFSAIQVEDEFVRKYMDWIGHSEFGLSYQPISTDELQFKNPSTLDHWLEQWLKVYQSLNDSLQGKSNVYFVSYERLCSEASVWRCIQEVIAVERAKDFDFELSSKTINYQYDDTLVESAIELYDKLTVSSAARLTASNIPNLT